MSTQRKYDLSVPVDIHAYLADTPFASDNITALSGGFANWTFRLYLRVPYEGRQTLVLKHGKSIVANTDIPFPVERQEFEVEALRRVGSRLPNDSLVVVPAVHYFDKNSSVTIMDDCGESAVSLKRFMQEGNPSPALGGKIGAALGEFLGSLHSWGRDDTSVLDFFEANQQTKQLAVWTTYGRLTSTLDGSDALPALCDPLLDIPQSRLETITKLAKEISDQIACSRESLSHGDFWPGNIMVSFQTDQGSGEYFLKQIYILDWEAVSPGLPGLDIGQWCAEMYLLHRFHPSCSEAVPDTVTSFLQSYRRIYGYDNAIARTAVLRVGAHLVAWTPRVPWGNKEQTRAVVQEGIEYLTEGSGVSDDWLKKSLVSILE